MNKNKKILFIFSFFIFLILIIWVFLENSNFSINKNSFLEEKKIQEDFFSENNFEDRENMINQELSKVFNIDRTKVSALIAQESDKYVVGLYFVNTEEEALSGKFFGIINNSIEIVWHGSKKPDCEVLLKNNFPQEMIPDCF